MVLALLSGASPKTCKEGPVVRLPRGKWLFHLQGLKESKFNLKVEGHPHSPFVIDDHFELSLVEPVQVQLEFAERGSEQYITALAERIHAA